VKNTLLKHSYLLITLITLIVILPSCKEPASNAQSETNTVTYPHDVIPFMDKWKILLGDGTREADLTDYKADDFFYIANDGDQDWVVYKTPNSGVTSRTSSNTRTELHQQKSWIPETGGNLSGTLKVMHVSTSGDARAAASYSVVVGQIHSEEGHENEPLKIFYKKFPGHTKGSVFWNYEINTEGANAKRWDFSHAVWGYDMADTGSGPDTYPREPTTGIALGEEFTYEVNIHEGTMYLSFKAEGHEQKTFRKDLLTSKYTTPEDLPEQTRRLFGSMGQDGVERENAYAGEKQYFKQGAYNQSNGKPFESNMVWSAGADTYDGDINKQYENGDYAEVWFKSASIGPGTLPNWK